MSDFFTQTEINNPGTVVIMLISALICGLIITAVYRIGTANPSKHMMISILIVPAIVQAIIMSVNNSIGAGIAAVGAFSLIRFRSIPGSSRDICILFFAMSTGLISGMGFVGYAVTFAVILSIIIVIAEKIISPGRKGRVRQLKIVIPEDVDYSNAFNDIFTEYMSDFELVCVKTVRMGVMYELIYHVTYKKDICEKDMLDKIRCRNGNLTVCSEIIPDIKEEL